MYWCLIFQLCIPILKYTFSSLQALVVRNYTSLLRSPQIYHIFSYIPTDRDPLDCRYDHIRRIESLTFY
jgi:hypothetical protein